MAARSVRRRRKGGYKQTTCISQARGPITLFPCGEELSIGPRLQIMLSCYTPAWPVVPIALAILNAPLDTITHEWRSPPVTPGEAGFQFKMAIDCPTKSLELSVTWTDAGGTTYPIIAIAGQIYRGPRVFTFGPATYNDDSGSPWSKITIFVTPT